MDLRNNFVPHIVVDELLETWKNGNRKDVIAEIERHPKMLAAKLAVAIHRRLERESKEDGWRFFEMLDA